MEAVHGRGDAQLGGHGWDHLRHGLQLQPVGADEGFLLLLQSSVSLVHRPKFIPSSAHSVRPDRCGGSRRGGELDLSRQHPPIASYCKC